MDAITVLVDTGIRPGELYRLAPRDLDMKEGTIYMTKRVRAIIERRRGAVTAPTDKLFTFDNFWMRNT